MRVVLNYEGPLPANGSPKDKQRIRRAFHLQLKAFWDQDSVLWRRLHAWTDGWSDTRPKHINDWADFTPEVQPTHRGGFDFIPLVDDDLYLVCWLDITFMRREKPGKLFESGGDLDNRLKTFFDSLSIPPHENQLEGITPQPDEDQFFCLLKDDALITGFQIRTEQWLEPKKKGEKKGDVHIKVTAVVRPTEVIPENLGFLGGWLGQG